MSSSANVSCFPFSTVAYMCLCSTFLLVDGITISVYPPYYPADKLDYHFDHFVLFLWLVAEAEDVTVWLTAPTGVTAFNIQGMTVHSALLFGTSKFTTQPLTQQKLITLRMKLSNLQLLIIDDISMVRSNVLFQIHKRLQKLKGKGDDTIFGNISILAVGDLYQLRPVVQPHVFAQVGDTYARL